MSFPRLIVRIISQAKLKIIIRFNICFRCSINIMSGPKEKTIIFRAMDRRNIRLGVLSFSLMLFISNLIP